MLWSRLLSRALGVLPILGLALSSCAADARAAADLKAELEQRGAALRRVDLGSGDEVVLQVADRAGRGFTVALWPPGSEGPAYARVGELRLTYRHAPGTAGDEAAASRAADLVREALEAAGCARRSTACFEALRGHAQATPRGKGRDRVAPRAPARPLLPWLWWIVGLGVPLGMIAAHLRRRPTLALALLAAGLALAALAWLRGPQGFIVENFRAGGILAEATRGDRTTVHGDSVYALQGVALGMAKLDEGAVFLAGALLAGLSAIVLAGLLLRVGLHPVAAFGAAALLGTHPLWLRHAATEALVIPSAYLWLLAVWRCVSPGGCRVPAGARRRAAALAGGALLDTGVLVLAAGARPEILVSLFPAALIGAWLRLRRADRAGAASLFAAFGVALGLHWSRVPLLVLHGGPELGLDVDLARLAHHLIPLRADLMLPVLGLLALLAPWAGRAACGVAAIAAVGWLAPFLLHLHIDEGPMAESTLRLGAQQLAPMALLAGCGLQALLATLSARFPAGGRWGPLLIAGVAAAGVACGAMSPRALVAPAALETQQGRAVPELLCGAGRQEGPIRFLALPQREDGAGILLPSTVWLQAERCLGRGLHPASLSELLRGVSLEPGQRGLVLLDATCGLDALDDQGRFVAPPVAEACAEVRDRLPLREIGQIRLPGPPLKPNQRIRDPKAGIVMRLLAIDGPWPRTPPPGGSRGL